MLWLVATILSYLFFALVSIVDRSLLKRSIPDPRVYTFYVGLLGIFSLVLFPLGFSIPEISEIFLALISGSVVLLALFALFTGLKRFEASRFIPAFGGFLPFFMLAFSYVQSGGEFLEPRDIIAFLILVSGSILITIERRLMISLQSLFFAFLTAFVFALSFLMMKLVYMVMPFWSGFIWIRIGSFLAAIALLLFSKNIRINIKQRTKMERRMAMLFFLNQGMGSLAVGLQSFALALVPVASLAFIGALQGVEYVFLLLLTLLLYFRFPRAIRENVSKSAIIQKVLAIALIVMGLVVLSFK